MTVYTQLHDGHNAIQRPQSAITGPVLSKNTLKSRDQEAVDDDADRLLRLALLVRGETTLPD